MRPAITLRLGLPADVVPIARLSRDVVEVGLRWSFTPGRVIECLRNGDTNVLVACDDDQVLGVGIMRYAPTHGHLELLAVRPEAQGHGLGRRIVEWLERPAVVGGASALWLEVRASNTGAQEFYRRLGYRAVARLARYYDGREDAIRMGREIAAV